MNNIIQPFLMALTLLTRLPVTRFIAAQWSSTHYRYSAYYYPLVGAGIGAVLMLLVTILPAGVSPLLEAALVLMVWVVASGALHLDGLADSADAYFAAHKNSEKALLIFKDPVSGPMAIVAVFLVLSLKLAALASLGLWLLPALFVAPILARAAALVLMNATAYARADESDGIAKGLTTPAGYVTWLVVAASCVAAVVVLPFSIGAIVVAVVALLTYWWRNLWLKLISGFTGDCLGALIEICEAAVLVTVAIVSLY